MVRKRAENRQMPEPHVDVIPPENISPAVRERVQNLLALLDKNEKRNPASAKTEPIDSPQHATNKVVDARDEHESIDEEEVLPLPAADEDEGLWTIEPSSDAHIDAWANPDILERFQEPGQQHDELAQMLAAFLLETRALAEDMLVRAIRTAGVGVVEFGMKRALAAIKEVVRAIESFLEHRAKIVPKKAIAVDIAVGLAAKLSASRKIAPYTPEWEIECIVRDLNNTLTRAIQRFQFEQSRHEPGHTGTYEIYRDLERGVLLAAKARSHILVKWQMAVDRYFDKTILETTARKNRKKALQSAAITGSQIPIH